MRNLSKKTINESLEIWISDSNFHNLLIIQDNPHFQPIFLEHFFILSHLQTTHTSSIVQNLRNKIVSNKLITRNWLSDPNFHILLTKQNKLHFQPIFLCISSCHHTFKQNTNGSIVWNLSKKANTKSLETVWSKSHSTHKTEQTAFPPYHFEHFGILSNTNKTPPAQLCEIPAKKSTKNKKTKKHTINATISKTRHLKTT